jgi:hypothetical protein
MSKIKFVYIYIKIIYMSEKMQVPTEIIDLPSKGLLYSSENPLSEGKVEMKYMTAKEEDILTNVNLLKQGLAMEKVMKSLIKSPIDYSTLLLGDRNALLIATRILSYGKVYSFKFRNPNTDLEEVIDYDLQNIGFKEIDYSLLSDKNEFSFTLPHSKTDLTFKLLTVGDSKKMEEEIKGLKKSLGFEPGELTTRLKYQITSVNGDRSTKTIREFVDGDYLLAMDSRELRKEIAKVTPDIDTIITFKTSDGEEHVIDLPLGIDFFFPGS